MKRSVSILLAALFVISLIAAMATSVQAAFLGQLDALYVNNNKYIGNNGYADSDSITITEGDKLFILGWIRFTKTDGLKEIKYGINGTLYACADVYRDRPDTPDTYSHGKHAGFGLDDGLMELTGIDKLEGGKYTLTLVAISNGGSSQTFRTYSLTVKTNENAVLECMQANEKVLGKEADLSAAKTVSLPRGGKLYVYGWASFSSKDKLKEITYTADGKEYACACSYTNRADLASAGVTAYNNGEHAGFGTSSDMAELTGIGSLSAGTHKITVNAVSDGGKRITVKEFNVKLPSVYQPGWNKGDVNGDGSLNNKDVVALFRLVSAGGAAATVEKCDINGDNNVNNKDVVALFRYVSSGSLPGSDTYGGTPAYTVNGDSIIVDGKKYPNTVNMKNGVLYAADDLDRELPLDNAAYTGDGTKNIGLFYFLWLGEHGDYGIYDITKILEKGGEAAKSSSYSGWGVVGAMHFWGEPIYGYYFSRDTWVMRKHVEELTAANVDFVYIDATNGFPYISNATQLMKIMHEFNEQGYTAPKIVFYTHSSCSNTVQQIYNSLYAKNTYPDTWYYLDGKPLIIAYESDCKSGLSSTAYNFFSYREPQWPNEKQKTNGWPWMDFNYPQRAFYNKSGKKEAMSVSVAQHSGTVCFSDSAIYGDRTNRGRSYKNGSPNLSENSALYGYNFEEQFDHAIAANVPYILITGWNEWVAQRQDPSQMGRPNQAVFVDTASMEYSRDIEPMRGGYFDNYYLQMIRKIGEYKGTAPLLVQDTRKPININGAFDQWDSVTVTYKDPSGDTVDRSSKAFGSKALTNTTGNNDIVSAKIVYDTKNIYFYAETANNITSPNTNASWMQLFINSDCEGGTGFSGFDYIVNYKANANGTTTVAKLKKTGNTYEVISETAVKYKISGNKIMISVPLSAVGIYDYTDIKIAFKWVDSKTKITTADQFYTDGDNAPIGRLCYVFCNKK
jgi:hypothetical protein